MAQTVQFGDIKKPQTRDCSSCGLVKTYDDFYKGHDRKDGYKSECKDCNRARERKYRQNNKEKMRLKTRKWRKENIERARELGRKTDKKRRNKKRQYIKFKRDTDIKFRLANNIRKRLKSALKVKKWHKTSKFTEYIGCNQQQLLEYIEKQFQPGMRWDNYGFGENKWCLDHIIPLSSAKTEEEIYKLSHYMNLKPMWFKDNQIKSNRII